MKKIATPSIVSLVIVMLMVFSMSSSAVAQEYFEAKEPSGGEMIYDFVVVRPFGIVATAIGAVFYVVSYPFAASGGNTDVAQEKLVKEPFRVTFKRPLGEF